MARHLAISFGAAVFLSLVAPATVATAAHATTVPPVTTTYLSSLTPSSATNGRTD